MDSGEYGEGGQYDPSENLITLANIANAAHALAEEDTLMETQELNTSRKRQATTTNTLPDGKAYDFQPLDNLMSGAAVMANGTLSIPSASSDDEGFYLCQADNGIGAGLSKAIQISVNEPVRFDVMEKNVAARRGDEVTLKCDIKGDHPIKVDWLYNGQRIHPNYRTSVADVKTDTGLQSQLVISQSDRQDSGLYTCQAGNMFGHGELLINLAIQEPPDPPLDVEVTEVNSRSIRLSWQPPFDGHSALTSYLLQYKRGTSLISDWQHTGTVNISVPASGTDFTSKKSDSIKTAVISDLHPATTYHIRMLAMNTIEASMFTEPLIVKTQEEAPVGPPQDVRAETIGPDELLITWKPPLSDTWNGEIVGYAVQWSPHGTSLSDTNNTNSSLVRGLQNTEIRLKQLKKFTKYDIYVQAFNSVGHGPKSSPFTVTTQEGVPEAAPQNVTCSPLSSKSVKVKWSPPPTQYHGGVIQGYKVIYRPVITDSTLQIAGSEVKRTASLETYLHGLLKFTNYSVRLLAYTNVGDGVLSTSVFCITEQDVPGPPAAIKALSLTSDSILVSWLPPEHPNGVLTQYTIYYSEKHGAQKPIRHQIGATSHTHEVRGLKELQQYEFWVTASTSAGEGDSTRPVLQAPNSRAPARIASFSQVLHQALKARVTLPCMAVGNPTPSVHWFYGNNPVKSNSVYSISQDLLHIAKLEKRNGGNYSCTAKNLFGEDRITYHIIVLTAPEPPYLEVLHADYDSLELQWTSPRDGGTPVLGYTMHYKKDHGTWQEVQMDAEKNSHKLSGIDCGATYHAYITAWNRIGNSHPSATVTARTKGTEPQIPSSNEILSRNATSLYLHLPSWPDGGCPMLYFVIEYRVLGSSSEWILVDNNAASKNVLIGDLQPGTWYQLRITAHNNAGSVRVNFKIATTTVTGATVSPIQESQTHTVHFYEDVYIIVPSVCSAILLFCAASLAYVTAHKRHCQEHPEYKTGQRVPESPNSCKAAAEMDNKRNFQQIYSSSPTKVDDCQTANHPDTSSEHYEMSPYATFAVSSDSPKTMNAMILDYTMQFKTFGHSENDSGIQHECVHQINKKRQRKGPDAGSGHESALSSSLRRHINMKQHHRKPSTCHNSESDTSGSPSAMSSYRVPTKPAASRSLEIYQLDSSTESNETSPLPQRRQMPRQPVCSSKTALQMHTRRGSSSAEDESSFSSYQLQPPCGFSDSRELSEAECDRDASELDKLLARFHQQKRQERLQHIIHV